MNFSAKMTLLAAAGIFMAACKPSTEANVSSAADSVAQSTASAFAAAPQVTGNPLPLETKIWSLEDLPPAFLAFQPDSQGIAYAVSGDLNLDAYGDVILVMEPEVDPEVLERRYEDPSVMELLEPRTLMILTGNEDGSFALQRKNAKTILCHDCGGVMGDPFSGIAIKKGYFSVEHYGGSSWRWTKIITYKFDPNANEWFLHQVGEESFQSGDPENSTEEVIKTKKDFGVVKFEDYDVDAG